MSALAYSTDRAGCVSHLTPTRRCTHVGLMKTFGKYILPDDIVRGKVEEANHATGWTPILKFFDHAKIVYDSNESVNVRSSHLGNLCQTLQYQVNLEVASSSKMPDISAQPPSK